MNTPLTWTEQDAKAVDIARVLAADAVDKVGNGHPGTAISLAPAAYLLYQKVLTGDPADPRWVGRDRFVLSAGHSSITQYNQLFLAGYGLEITDIAALRTWGSLTPGHPEFGHTAGVETTTGPLGAGISNMVGMAMAAKRERALLDPDAPAGESIFDRFIFGIAGDGCMQEGVASEAASLAGNLELGNLILIYDDNRITIEGDTKIAFSEDVLKRHEAYGWHTQHVDWTHGGTEYAEDVQALYDAIEAAKAVTDKPSIIRLTTIIGWPLPTKAGSHSVHGSKIGAEETAALKKVLGLDPEKSFDVDAGLLAYTRGNAADRAAAAKQAWTAKYEAWRAAKPEKAALFDRLVKRELPADFESALPVFAPGKKATRAASGEVLSALADAIPELWGGSADLAGSNNTTMKGQPSFLAPGHSTAEWSGDYSGRTLHFGIREHAMGGVINGIAQSGLTRPYCGTFLVFSDYMRPTARLAALQNLPSTFVWTHDSIGVGEDGPTHQPIEHLASLRAIPNFDVVRPADANETAAAWAQILRNTRPATIVLSRQDLPIFDRDNGFASTEGVAKGAYVLKEASAAPQVVLIGTGSEVQLAVAAAERLEAGGIPARVVSMPCVEWFNEQDDAYRASVLPAGVVRVSVEAGVPQGWREIVGDSGRIIGIDHFGASANGNLLFEKFGITADAVYAAAKDALA
ncbi:transketolase [Propionicicella superfundia]|uniref:transketolase n=1 Tax=Propionicicella superfundia TaxID=348582 RepID=UPI00048F4CEA|nr:transketolase [Propionicicella superfundia]